MNHTQTIRAEALRLGFDWVGFARAERMDAEARRLETWLNKGFHGEMKYMENHFDMRIDPTKLVDGAQTVVSLMFNYYTDETQADAAAPKISKYAYGTDYHLVIKEKLRELLDFIRATVEIGRAHV